MNMRKLVDIVKQDNSGLQQAKRYYAINVCLNRSILMGRAQSLVWRLRFISTFHFPHQLTEL